MKLAASENIKKAQISPTAFPTIEEKYEKLKNGAPEYTSL